LSCFRKIFGVNNFINLELQTDYMNLNQWCVKQEKIGNNLAKEYFNMEVGLKFSKANIAKLEKKNIKQNEYFLKNFEKPVELYWASVGEVAGSKTYKLSLRLKEERNKKISNKKHKVNWSTWRQWSFKANDKERKEVFDDFIKKTPLISRLIKDKFDKATKIYSQYELNPLQTYLDEHRISLNKLISVIKDLKDNTKANFLRQWKKYSYEILGREQQYYDDMYFMRNFIFAKIKLKNLDSLKIVKNTIEGMGFDFNMIKVDDANRKGKYPSPFCSGVKIPDDVRVSFKAENPINDLNSIHHEFGHAIHFISIDKKLPYWSKYIISNGLCETFSTFLEDFIQDKTYLMEEAKIDEETSEEIVARLSFIRDYATVFYCANSLFRIDYWRKNLNFEDCNKYYADKIKECMNIEIPGAYWQLHHILPESLMYVPSYLLAMKRADELRNKMKKEYGNVFWRNKEAGRYLKSVMKPGSKSELGIFSNLGNAFN